MSKQQAKRSRPIGSKRSTYGNSESRTTTTPVRFEDNDYQYAYNHIREEERWREEDWGRPSAEN
jgi:hypothetical protein